MKFFVTVDLVVLAIRGGRLHALLVNRRYPPFEGCWALPGGYVGADEDLLAAAHRELSEETAITDGVHLEQLATYGSPGRDPRGPTVTVAWLALLAEAAAPMAGTDAGEAAWHPVGGSAAGGVGPSFDAGAVGRPDAGPGLAFDHDRILADGVERARAKLEYSPLATSFCPQEFTVAQLRGIYEAVWGQSLDPRNFHRKVTRSPGFLVPTGRTSTVDGGRPAQLYTRGTLETLNPPLTRASA